MQITIDLACDVVESPRVTQVRGIFDLAREKQSSFRRTVRLPFDEKPWTIGLITGPSGSGKSTLANHLWPDQLRAQFDWPKDRSLLDGFPEEVGIKEITALLSSIGFSSPPAWLRPFHLLSTGEQFRTTLARHVAEAMADRDTLPIVVDEFTSVVDRTVARIGSAALARTLRKHSLPFVAVSCHNDVIEWLQPDWIYSTEENAFQWRCLRQRPDLPLDLVRTTTRAWPIFAPHHYLNTKLVSSATCFLACWENRPVAFSAWLPYVGKGKPARREHRTVTLPDFQGVGIGNAVSATLASMWSGLGFRSLSTTTHPAMIHARSRSPLWHMRRAPSLARVRERKIRHALTRLTAGFEYVGPAMPRRQAQTLLGA